MDYMKVVSRVIVLLFILALSSQAADSVYPATSLVTVEYLWSSQTPAAGESVDIIRILKNNESFPLTGLYFSENLPPEISIDSYIVTVNDSAVNSDYTGPLPDDIENGFDCYRWLIDSPDPISPYQVTLNPGDSIILTTTVSCSTEGSYQLPFHTVSFYGNGDGLFAMADPESITFGPPPDTIPPAAIIDLTVEPVNP